MPRWTGNVLLFLGSALISLACMEAGVALVLESPALLPSGPGALGKPRRLANHYYKNHIRRSVQFLPECAQYDPEVTYTLRPGASCRVARYGKVTEYSANRAGLRDSDSALDKPAVVVLGDSHAMGSGVPGTASFPKQLERSLGLRVLNAGMESFGTARELALLERLQLPSSTALVIQYCDNDFRENRVYVDNGALPILSEREYGSIVDHHLETTRYYPFKHVRNFLGSAGRLIFHHRAAAKTDRQSDSTEARYFLETMRRHDQLIEGRTVVVLELNGYRRDDGGFIGALRQRLAEPQYAELARWVTAIDVSVGLEAADYLPLDGHMRPRGHRKVARLLAQELSRRGL